MKLIDITGQRFGRLTVVGRGPNTSDGHPRWHCACDCTGTTLTTASNLKRGMTTTCGCIFSKGHPNHPRKTHGMAKVPEYDVWTKLKARCNNHSDKSYHNYGGRGITVCERWGSSFEAFIEDMGRRPTAEHSVERRDNDGPYSAENCYWATVIQQQNNRRTNRCITHNGKTQTLQAWAKESKVTGQHLRGRLRDGWYFADAIRLPVGARRPRKRPRNEPEP